MSFRRLCGLIGALVLNSWLVLGGGSASAARLDGRTPTTTPARTWSWPRPESAAPGETSAVSLPTLPGIGEVRFPVPPHPAGSQQARSQTVHDQRSAPEPAPEASVLVGAESSPGLRPILAVFGGLIVTGGILLLLAGPRRRAELDPG